MPFSPERIEEEILTVLEGVKPLTGDSIIERINEARADIARFLAVICNR